MNVTKSGECLQMEKSGTQITHKVVALKFLVSDFGQLPMEYLLPLLLIYGLKVLL